MITRLQRILSRPGVWFPAALLGLLSGLLAAWLRVFAPDTLRAMSETGVDLRISALAFGLMGAFGAARGPGHVSRQRRLSAALGVTGALAGVGLIVVGLVGAPL